MVVSPLNKSPRRKWMSTWLFLSCVWKVFKSVFSWPFPMCVFHERQLCRPLGTRLSVVRASCQRSRRQTPTSALAVRRGVQLAIVFDGMTDCTALLLQILSQWRVYNVARATKSVCVLSAVFQCFLHALERVCCTCSVSVFSARARAGVLHVQCFSVFRTR